MGICGNRMEVGTGNNLHEKNYPGVSPVSFTIFIWSMRILYAEMRSARKNGPKISPGIPIKEIPPMIPTISRMGWMATLLPISLALMYEPGSQRMTGYMMKIAKSAPGISPDANSKRTMKAITMNGPIIGTNWEIPATMARLEVSRVSQQVKNGKS